MAIPRCDLQDYLEIACLFKYEIRILCNDDTSTQGIARDVFSKQGKETLVMDCDGNAAYIDTSTMVSMDVITPGARFSHISFSD